MFKLIDLAIGNFAIEKSGWPMLVHGFIRVFDEQIGYNAVRQFNLIALLSPYVSKELKESGEIEALKEEAIRLTEEAIYDEYNN